MSVPEPLREDARELELRGGRRLAVIPGGPDDLVEVRAEDGALELRIRLTADGPVLEVESVRMSLRASESLELETKDLSLKASGEIGIAAEGDVRVTGEYIHLN